MSALVRSQTNCKKGLDPWLDALGNASSTLPIADCDNQALVMAELLHAVGIEAATDRAYPSVGAGLTATDLAGNVYAVTRGQGRAGPGAGPGDGPEFITRVISGNRRDDSLGFDFGAGSYINEFEGCAKVSDGTTTMWYAVYPPLDGQPSRLAVIRAVNARYSSSLRQVWFFEPPPPVIPPLVPAPSRELDQDFAPVAIPPPPP